MTGAVLVGLMALPGYAQSGGGTSSQSGGGASMQTGGGSAAPAGAQGVDAAGQPANAQAGAGQSSSGMSDQDFFKKAAESNLAEIQIGQLAQQKASSDDVKQLAQKLVTDHQANMQQLQQLAQKKGVTLPDKPDSKHAAMLAKMQNMSGADFDKAFTKSQVKDHQKNIDLFSRQASQAKDPDVKSYASQTVDSLHQHLDSARSSMKSSGNSAKSGGQDNGSTTAQSSQRPPQ
jgi:putative membrane protein